MEERARLRSAIRDVADFPQPGIVFKDITPLLASAPLLATAVDLMTDPFHGAGISHVVAIESRGFLFGGAVARLLACGLVPVRKPGKLPWSTTRETYELEYGSDALEMHADALDASARVLIVDDVLATGGTAAATRRLVERSGARVVGVSVLVELCFLHGRARLGDLRLASVLTY